MSNLALVNAVLKHQIECTTGNLLATVLGAVGPNPSFARYPRDCKLLLERTNRLEGKIAAVNVDDGAGLLVIDHQAAILCIVPDRRVAPHPHALLLGGGDLVAHPLADDLAL